MGVCASQSQRQQVKTQVSRINIRQVYRFGKVLGSGSYGTVKIGYRENLLGEQIFAIKTINKLRVRDHIDMIAQEFEILHQADHPNIIRFYEMFEDEMYIYFVMEYCKGGDLLDRILKNPYSEEEAKAVMQKLFSAVKYMHQMNIIHRDLKPENIMFQGTEVKIIDFGLSKKIKNQKKQSQTVGTPMYAAPEVILGNYDERCDNWALGCIMYVVLSGEPPFYKEDLQQLLKSIKEDSIDFSMDIWDTISNQAKDLIMKLLQKDPNQRITAAQASQHQWFKHKQLKLMLDLNTKHDIQKVQSVNTPINSTNIKSLKAYANYKSLKQQILQTLLHHLSYDSISKLTDKFQQMDKTEDGVITYDDLQQAMLDLGFVTSLQEVEQLLIKFQDGTPKSALKIKYSQFLAAVLDSKLYLNKERLWSLFKYFDVDNKNYLTREDILQAFLREGRQPKMIIPEQITFKDFCQIMHDEMDNQEFFEYYDKFYSSPVKN